MSRRGSDSQGRGPLQPYIQRVEDCRIGLAGHLVESVANYAHNFKSLRAVTRAADNVFAQMLFAGKDFAGEFAVDDDGLHAAFDQPVDKTAQCRLVEVAVLPPERREQWDDDTFEMWRHWS